MELSYCHLADDDRAVFSYFTCKSGEKARWAIYISDIGIFVLYHAWPVSGGTAPILTDAPDTLYSNPLPHVLILTAIVVGVATTALGLALILRIRESFGSIEEDEILAVKNESAAADMPQAKPGVEV